MSPERRLSAADRTGPSAAFGTARARSTRGQIIDSVVGAAPTAVSPDRVAENPGNPRQEFDEDYITGLAQNMREVGQVQTATVMTRLAFVVSHPEHMEAVPSDCDYVVIDGHCRLRAAREAGIDLRITVDDSSAGTREDLLAAALSANHFRKDLTPIEEAEAIETLVEFHGSAAAVVSVLGGAVNDSWVSTRRALLKLPKEIQARVADKEVPIAIARKAGSLSNAEDQTAYVESKMAQRKAEQAQKPKPVRGRAAAAAAKRKPADDSPQPNPNIAVQAQSSPDLTTATAQPQVVPEPRGASPAPTDSRPVDWTNPEAVTTAILERCTPEGVQMIVRSLVNAS